MAETPAHLHYTSDHEWVAQDGDTITVGITRYAADSLGDVVYVEHPKVGASVKKGSIVGEVESTKSVGEIFAPASGEVTEINEGLTTRPETINDDPYGAGWLFKMTVTEMGDLLDATAYEALTGGN